MSDTEVLKAYKPLRKRYPHLSEKEKALLYALLPRGQRLTVRIIDPDPEMLR